MEKWKGNRIEEEKNIHFMPFTTPTNSPKYKNSRERKRGREKKNWTLSLDVLCKCVSYVIFSGKQICLGSVRVLYFLSLSLSLPLVRPKRVHIYTHAHGERSERATQICLTDVMWLNSLVGFFSLSSFTSSLYFPMNLCKYFVCVGVWAVLVSPFSLYWWPCDEYEKLWTGWKILFIFDESIGLWNAFKMCFSFCVWSPVVTHQINSNNINSSRN